MAISEESPQIPANAGGEITAEAGPGRANPAALTVEQLARTLALPEDTVHAHLAAGAPAAPGGTINLIHYVAWLNKELASRDGD